MSHELVFTILPFNPLITPDAKIQLPVDHDDLIRQLQRLWPSGEVTSFTSEGDTVIRLYIPTKREGNWNIASFLDDYSIFEVSGWPKPAAKKIILWYRQYIPMRYPLFLVIPEDGSVTELTASTSSDDIDKLYPYSVLDDEPLIMEDQQALLEIMKLATQPLAQLGHIQEAKSGFCVENNRMIALSLRGCDLTTIPDTLWELSELQTLIVGENPLNSLSGRIGELKHLKQLYIYNTELTALPDSIGSLTDLRILDLGHNKLTTVPESLGNLVSLSFLYLHDNKLAALPAALFERLDRLTYLNVGDNWLMSPLPESISRLTNLRELRADNAHLSALPESLGNLTQLRELHARSNWFQRLPESLGKLVDLRRLYLQGNRLTVLPDLLGDLRSLTELDLRNNRLTVLPESLGKLANLVYLDLRANPLTVLPPSIGDLPKLEKLDLRWTRLASIPAWMERLEARGCGVYR